MYFHVYVNIGLLKFVIWSAWTAVVFLKPFGLRNLGKVAKNLMWPGEGFALNWKDVVWMTVITLHTFTTIVHLWRCLPTVSQVLASKGVLPNIVSYYPKAAHRVIWAQGYTKHLIVPTQPRTHALLHSQIHSVPMLCPDITVHGWPGYATAYHHSLPEWQLYEGCNL